MISIFSELRHQIRRLRFKLNNRHIQNQELKIAKIIKKALNKYVRVIDLVVRAGKIVLYYEFEKQIERFNKKYGKLRE